MTKKHFIALADHIKRENTKGSFLVFNAAAIDSLARFCVSQNPQFNQTRWIDYLAGHCGPNGGSISKHMDER